MKLADRLTLTLLGCALLLLVFLGLQNRIVSNVPLPSFIAASPQARTQPKAQLSPSLQRSDRIPFNSGLLQDINPATVNRMEGKRGGVELVFNDGTRRSVAPHEYAQLPDRLRTRLLYRQGAK